MFHLGDPHASLAQDAPEATPARPTSRPSVCVLVEDDSAVRAFVKLVLEGESFKVVETDGATEALHLLERLGGRVELLVSDVNMPGMSGLTLLERVRDSVPSLPVVLLSGEPQPVASLADPAVQFVPKPFRGPELLNAVRRVTPTR